MTENKKRSRKSKIEARECDYEVVVNEKEEVSTPVSQKPASIVKIEEPEKLMLCYEHDYCQPGFQQFAKSPSLAVRIPSSVSSGITYSGLSKISNIIRKSDRTLKESNKLKPYIKMNSQLIEKGTNRTNDSIKMCKYDPDLLLKTSHNVSAESTNLADRILDTELRNLWGNILYAPGADDPHEKLLQKVIEVWQVWMGNGWKNTRKSPLFYQCHICTLAWWRLHDFRQHIRTHESARLRLYLKEIVHECLFVASYEPVTKLLFIDIEGTCWKCGNDVDYHKDNACIYRCDICQKSMYTCEKRRLHDSECRYPTELAMFNISLDRKCSVCECVLDSFRDIVNHMIQVHSVPSDLPCPNTFKTCAHCNGKYYLYSEHNCSKSAKNAACDFCCRKFATKQLATSHMISKFNDATKCRVCFKDLDKKCMEMEHMVKFHSENYQLAYKCTICANQYLLFIDEFSLIKHKHLWHKRKTDKRRNYYETVLVPKLCLQEGSIEETFHKDHDYDSRICLDSDEGSEPDSYEQSRKRKDKIDEDDDFTIPELSPKLTKLILTPEVDVTVDEVDIKKEAVEYDENGQIDYEEMLKNMFNIQSDKPKSPQPSASKIPPAKSTKFDVKIPSAFFDQDIPCKSTDIDIACVRIKQEPVDDIEVIDNPVETVEIKSEPLDINDAMNMDPGNIKEHFIFRIKDEPMDDKNPSVQTFQVVPNKIAKPKKTRITKPRIIVKRGRRKDLKEQVAGGSGNDIFKEFISDPNTNEVTFKVMNPRGKCKEKKVYVCTLCGFSAPYKQYRIHKETVCSNSMNPVNPMNQGLNLGPTSGHLCSKCGLNFVMFRDYVLHFDHHGFDMMTCPVCNEVFQFQSRLLSHVQRHIKADYVGIRLLKKSGFEFTKAHRKVKCRKCNKVITQDHMFSHWETHLDIKPTSCKIEQDKEVRVKIEPPELDLTSDSDRDSVNNKVLDPASLKAAIDHLTTTENIDKACAVCYRAFVRRPDTKRHVIEHLLLDAHMHKHETGNLFRCQICKEGFSNRERYKSHMREHGAMPIFQCELCNKNFSDSSNFAKHKKTHNVRVLICDICYKKFHSKPALEKHIAEHSTQVHIKCGICGKMCMTPTLYRKHRYQAHDKNKFKCKLCDDLKFDSLQHKWDHDWLIHKQRKHKADCPICLKSFRKFQDVRAHARLEHKSEVRVMKMGSAAMLYKIKNKTNHETLVVDA